MILLNISNYINWMGLILTLKTCMEKKNEVLVQFQKSLYEKMHAKGLLVSQDVQPFNQDYNFKELSEL